MASRADRRACARRPRHARVAAAPARPDDRRRLRGGVAATASSTRGGWCPAEPHLVGVRPRARAGRLGDRRRARCRGRLGAPRAPDRGPVPSRRHGDPRARRGPVGRARPRAGGGAAVILLTGSPSSRARRWCSVRTSSAGSGRRHAWHGRSRPWPPGAWPSWSRWLRAVADPRRSGAGRHGVASAVRLAGLLVLAHPGPHAASSSILPRDPARRRARSSSRRSSRVSIGFSRARRLPLCPAGCRPARGAPRRADRPPRIEALDVAAP